jgi:molybdopterin/thiamine biosynthesis adenylyltransferase
MDLSRNWLFISPEEQVKISNQSILFAGTGLGSAISVNLSRIGFKNFTLADGDIVDPSNLNRQYFNKEHIGENKALSCSKEILKINPQANVKVLQKFLTSDDLKVLIPNNNFIINAIDFNSKEFINCNKIAKENNKTEIFSINLGFGACTMIFDSSTPNLMEFFKISDPFDLKIKILSWIIEHHGSEFIKNKFQEFQTKPNLPEPQIITAVLLNSALVSKILVDITTGRAVKKFPEVYYLEI